MAILCLEKFPFYSLLHHRVDESHFSFFFFSFNFQLHQNDVMKMTQQDAEVWWLLVSVLLFTKMASVDAQFCPSPETILPCTCNTVDGEIQVW